MTPRVLASILLSLVAQDGHRSTMSPPLASLNLPFPIGETFRYDAKLGLLTLGTAYMSFAGIDTVRGTETMVFRFGAEGGIPFLKYSSVLESWTGVKDFASRRFHSRSEENGRVYDYEYEIYPDSGFYRRTNQDRTWEAPANPLDEAAFLYFLRSFKRGSRLKVGSTYTFSRYFKKEINPVVLNILGREKMKLPDGSEVECLVVNPIVGENRILSSEAQTKVWVTDDRRRIPVRIRSRQPFGNLTLELTEVIIPPAPASTSPAIRHEPKAKRPTTPGSGA